MPPQSRMPTSALNASRRVVVALLTLQCLLTSGSMAFQQANLPVALLSSRRQQQQQQQQHKNTFPMATATVRLPSPSAAWSSSSSPTTKLSMMTRHLLHYHPRGHPPAPISKSTSSSQLQESSVTSITTNVTDEEGDDTIITQTDATTNNNAFASVSSFLVILWRFSRPHTIIGSALAIPAIHLLASPTLIDAFTARSVTSILYAMLPSLLMNLYITGLNQVTDVEIDKVNKPDLPLAAGDWSVRTGSVVTVSALILSVVLGFAVIAPTTTSSSLSTPGLQVALGWSAVLGTVYSLPPLRLKRFPFWAAFCIVAVRGAVINAGFYAHAIVAAYGGSAGGASVWKCLTTDPRCMLSSLYFAVFGVVIALMKDVPDVKGDSLAKVRTFSVRLGPSIVFKWMHRLLTTLFWGVGLAYYKAAATGTTASWAIRLGRAIAGTSALLAGASVHREAAPVDPEDSREVYGFYMHLWKLFYLSYLVMPLAR